MFVTISVECQTDSPQLTTAPVEMDTTETKQVFQLAEMAGKIECCFL